MSLKSLDTLELRMVEVVKLVQRLKAENEILRIDLDLARKRIHEQEAHRQEWESERTDIGGRIDQVLTKLNELEGTANSCETMTF